MGSAVGGQAGREEAIAHGAEPWQTDVAYYANSAFGLTEGLPINVALGKLDGITGGIISKRFEGKAGELSAAAIQGLITEGLQESLQTIGSNWTASDLAKYDPSRPLNENLMEAAGIGGSTGMLVNLLATSIGVKRRTQLQQELQENFLDPIGANSLDEVAGPVVVLDEKYVNLQKRIAQLDEQLEGLGEENPAELIADRQAARDAAAELQERMNLTSGFASELEINSATLGDRATSAGLNEKRSGPTRLYSAC